jgi:hypothetical protein
VLYSVHSMAMIVSRACAPPIWGWDGGARMWGSHADHMVATSSRARPGVRRAITASWKGPSMRRVREVEMWSKRNWSGSGSNGAARNAAKVSSLVGGAATVGAWEGVATVLPAYHELEGDERKVHRYQRPVSSPSRLPQACHPISSV